MVFNETTPLDTVVDSTSSFQGMQVRLRSITPALVSERQDGVALPAAIPAELLALKPAPYRLGLYDVVTVAVWEHPELSMPLGQYRADLASGQMVDDRGSIFYPYAGMVPSQGLTSGQLREKLLTELSKVLNNPQLDVKVTGFRSQKVFVHGAVGRQGVVPVTDIPLSLLDAVNQSGGLSPQGDASRVELTRAGVTYVVDLFGRYAGNSGPPDVFLQDGDVVRVGDRFDNKVYLMGEVATQAAVPLNNGHLSLVQALGEVGGLSPLSAESKGIYVIRATDRGHIDVYHLNARNPLALAMGDQFPLKPRDIVFVDATGLARWNRLINLILPTVSAVNGITGSAVNIQTLTK
jgi:polysaccharide export outer membrane protein